jgi:hypothetical protein
MFENLSGAELAAALASVDVAVLGPDDALSYALAAARLAGWAATAETAGLAQLRQTYPVLDPAAVGENIHHLDTGRLVLAEIRAAYGCSQVAGSAKMNFAEFLSDVPAVATTLATGVIRLEHARMLARETAPFASSPGVRAAVVEELLAAQTAAVEATGSGWTTRQWSIRIARAVLEADPSRAEQSAADTRAEQRVWHSADTAHAEGTLGLTGPVEETATCYAAVDALARQWQAQGRAGTLAQLRFDAACHLLTGADVRSASGVVYGQVTIPLSSLVGADDAPGELTGAGPIPASVARKLMASATLWRRLLTDPVDGHLVTQQIKSYRPNAAMRRFVLARSGGVCSARGCGARHELQLDHVIPSPNGPTSVVNLVTQCPPDHNGKTHGGWVHVLDPETGALTQISPLGRTYSTSPTPPVASTGRHGDPPGRRARVWIDPDEIYFPTGEPPPDPAECETAPPDPLAHVDRWPTIAARIRDRARIAHRDRLAAAAAEQALIDQMHAELEAATDYRMIAAINAEYLAEDLAT